MGQVCTVLEKLSRSCVQTGFPLQLVPLQLGDIILQLFFLKSLLWTSYPKYQSVQNRLVARL